MENSSRILINKGESVINAGNLTNKNTSSQPNSLSSSNSSQKPNNFLKTVNQDKVLEIVKQKGPITINQIKRELHADSVIISAYLSEFINKKLIRVTSVQLGSSVFYYISEQKVKLESLIQYLNDKDQGIVHLLKEKKVLRDYDQTLFVRASLRKIKDFAIPIRIALSNVDSEIFWVYYLLNEDEAKQKIREILNPALKKSEKTIQEKPKIVIQEKNSDILKEKQESVSDTSVVKSEVKPIAKVEEKSETIFEKKDDSPRKELLKKLISKPKELIVKSKESQNIIESEVKIDDKLKIDNKFIELKKALEDKNILIEMATLVRKAKEYDLIIKVKTAIGYSRFFAKFKDKKRCNDSDISTAIVIGQSKQLPVAFITSGELSKKTKQKTNTLFHNVMIVEKFGQ